MSSTRGYGVFKNIALTTASHSVSNNWLDN